MSERIGFEEAMNVECRDCGRTAKRHRLTPSANLYCLTLNERGKEQVTRQLRRDWGVWGDLDLYRIEVKYLVRSSLPKEVGRAIQKGLDSYEQSG